MIKYICDWKDFCFIYYLFCYIFVLIVFRLLAVVVFGRFEYIYCDSFSIKQTTINTRNSYIYRNQLALFSWGTDNSHVNLLEKICVWWASLWPWTVSFIFVFFCLRNVITIFDCKKNAMVNNKQLSQIRGSILVKVHGDHVLMFHKHKTY